MKGTKQLLESKTIVSAGVLALMLVVNWAGLDLDEGIVTEFMIALVQLGSISGVIYGRIKADRKIRFSK